MQHSNLDDFGENFWEEQSSFFDDQVQGNLDDGVSHVGDTLQEAEHNDVSTEVKAILVSNKTDIHKSQLPAPQPNSATPSSNRAQLRPNGAHNDTSSLTTHLEASQHPVGHVPDRSTTFEYQWPEEDQVSDPYPQITQRLGEPWLDATNHQQVHLRDPLLQAHPSNFQLHNSNQVPNFSHSYHEAQDLTSQENYSQYGNGFQACDGNFLLSMPPTDTVSVPPSNNASRLGPSTARTQNYHAPWNATETPLPDSLFTLQNEHASHVNVAAPPYLSLPSVNHGINIPQSGHHPWDLQLGSDHSYHLGGQIPEQIEAADGTGQGLNGLDMTRQRPQEGYAPDMTQYTTNGHPQSNALSGIISAAQPTGPSVNITVDSQLQQQALNDLSDLFPEIAASTNTPDHHQQQPINSTDPGLSPAPQDTPETLSGRPRRRADSPKCVDCGKGFRPKDSRTRCARCHGKYIRASAQPPHFSLDPTVNSYTAARRKIYPPPAPSGPRVDDVATECLRENYYVERLIAAISQPYTRSEKPAAATTKSIVSTGAGAKPANTAAFNNSNDNGGVGSVSGAARSAGLKRDPDEEWGLRQQAALNGNAAANKHGEYDNAMVTARVRMLFRAAVGFHKGCSGHDGGDGDDDGGELVYALGGDNKGYIADSALKFSQRMAEMRRVLRIDKRVAMDVIEGRGVLAFVSNPEAFHARKLSNKDSNNVKKEQLLEGKAKGELSVLVVGEDEDEDDAEGKIERERVEGAEEEEGEVQLAPSQKKRKLANGGGLVVGEGTGETAGVRAGATPGLSLPPSQVSGVGNCVQSEGPASKKKRKRAPSTGQEDAVPMEGEAQQQNDALNGGGTIDANILDGSTEEGSPSDTIYGERLR